MFSHLCFERTPRKKQSQVSSSCDYFRIIGVLLSCAKIELRHEQIFFFFYSLYDADAMDWTKVTWSTACHVCLHWRCVSERPHAFMLPCPQGAASFEWDIFLFFSIAVCK